MSERNRGVIVVGLGECERVGSFGRGRVDGDERGTVESERCKGQDM